MRLLGLAAGACAGALSACSLLSLDGLTGSTNGWADGATPHDDAPHDAAPADAGGGGGPGDSPAPADGGGPGDVSVAPETGGGEVGPGPEAPSLPPYRIVFVTSQLYGGNLGGVQGADAKCQALAQHAGLPGTFFAWLSDGTVTPAARMPHENLPYVLADGNTQVAADWNALLSGTLDHAIDTTELRTQVTPVPSCGPQGYIGNFVWTDTSNAAVEWNNGDECASWASAGNGATGSTGNASSTIYWTEWCVGVPCGVQAALYCVQQ
jgi:hypothetical protein